MGFEDYENAHLLAKKVVENYSGGWYWQEIPPVWFSGNPKVGLIYGYFGGSFGPWEKDFYNHNDWRCIRFPLRVIVELCEGEDDSVFVAKLSH